MRDVKRARRLIPALFLALLASGLPQTQAATVHGRALPYVVRFRPATALEDRTLALASVGGRASGLIPELRLAEVVLDPGQAASLSADPAVQWLHPTSYRHVAAGRPNDPLFRSQWALSKMGALSGWRHEDGSGDPVTVAVVDTGVDPSHPDLRGRLLDGVDLVNTDDDPADDFGHGTHVAGIIAARPDNHRGIAGMSWGARILPVKACDSTGACDDFLVVGAIVYAIRSGARVVNMSLAGPADQGCPPEYDLAARLAEADGVLLVAAVGNSGSEKDGNPVMYPAACDGYLGVGATASDDTWAPFSEHDDYVDLSAPGVQVESTLPPALLMDDDPTTPGYGPADGTSMAAPHVAGLAALLLAQNPDWTPAQIEERMLESAVDLGARGRDPYFGEGRIDMARALRGES